MTQQRISYTTLFGPYVMHSFQHGSEEQDRHHIQEKQREQELFEVVDDYVEQA